MLCLLRRAGPDRPFIAERTWAERDRTAGARPWRLRRSPPKPSPPGRCHPPARRRPIPQRPAWRGQWAPPVAGEGMRRRNRAWSSAAPDTSERSPIFMSSSARTADEAFPVTHLQRPADRTVADKGPDAPRIASRHLGIAIGHPCPLTMKRNLSRRHDGLDVIGDIPTGIRRHP